MRLAVSIHCPVDRCLRALDGLLFVSVDVELDEEQQVAAKQSTAKDGRTFGTLAVTNVREVRVVVVHEVLVS